MLALRDRHGAVTGGEAREDGGVGDDGDVADARDGSRGRGADDGVGSDCGMEEVRSGVSGVVEREAGEQVARRGPRGCGGEEQGGEDKPGGFHGYAECGMHNVECRMHNSQCTSHEARYTMRMCGGAPVGW